MLLANIGSGSETLTLTAEEGALRPDELVCDLRAETMSASRRVYALEFTGLAEFFEELAKAGGVGRDHVRGAP